MAKDKALAKDEFSPYEIEQIVLAQPLVWGSQAAMAVLPNLTSDKFVYGSTGMMGGSEHRIIWHAIEQCVLIDRAEPYKGNLTGIKHFSDYIDTLIGKLSSYYGMYEFDFNGYRKRAVQIHRTGRMFRMGMLGKKLGEIVKDQETFQLSVNKVNDVDAWTSSVLRGLASTGDQHSGEGYVPMHEVASEVIEDWERQKAGEQLVILPVGIPLLYEGGLFPTPSYAVVHGLSGGAKSTFVHNIINLGTAMGLVQANLRGCVAINSLEMTKKQVLARMAAHLAGFNLFSLLGDPALIKDEDFNRLKYYAEFVGKLPIVIDPTNDLTPPIMEYRMNAIHMGTKGPIRQLSSDYLELFKMPEFMTKEDNEALLAEISRYHFQFSRDFLCSVISISQSTYDSGSKVWIAGLYGMRGSRAITHKADIVMEVVNYAALKRAGTPYKVAEGLDDENMWALLQKYRGGPTDRRMAFGWEPEFTRLYDPYLRDQAKFGGSNPLFEHMDEVEKLLREHPTTGVLPIEDTPLAHLVPPPTLLEDWYDYAMVNEGGEDIEFDDEEF